MAPAPAPAPAMDVEDEGGCGAKNQNNMVVVNSEDVPTGGFNDGGALLVPCSRPAGGHPVVVNSEPVKDEGGDTTECSSSFGDTCSGFDDEVDSGEPEVNSHISAAVDGDLASRPHRKKVTAEWRNSVRPILWRCQWLELRMKDLSSQVSKYDRELALIKKEKEAQQVVSTTNGSMPESMQVRKGHGNSSMKRRKRKRHEDTVDTSLYINKHQILSYYYDKQNKGAEADDLLIHDDCNSPVDRSITGGLGTAALLDPEEYDMISEQLDLQNILLTIDGVQSQVHLLQDRLSKAHLEEETLAFSEDNTQVRVARKRQSTQKRSFSYKKHQYTKPQKKKNLNILLKDDDVPALAARPALPDRETNGQIEDVKGNTEEKNGEWNHSQDTAITVDLLLGADNSLPNGHMGDFCKESTDDILINNQAANEGCQQFEKVKLLASETSSKGQNISAPVEMKNTCAPVKVDDTCAPVKVESDSAPVVKQELFLERSAVMKPVCPGKKQGRKVKKKKKGGGSAFSMKKQSNEASKTLAAKQETESTPSAEMELETMTPLSAWKKLITGNKSKAAKKRKTGASASKQQERRKSFSAAKKRKTENSSSAAKKQETENSSAAAKGPQAVLVAVNSRRSQRVRKPKVY
ncbi:uncharacterized protein LOC133911264 [Phragmites australis]|uniref:uncharacterized protein LOC133911264 n=1 Tax=Phragmites australis TaxID=29695 RepID=UPI002D77BB03|nr:uncharacterized protein LOC133911264 [Phragmites australis]